jgi:hypothetical protein
MRGSLRVHPTNSAFGSRMSGHPKTDAVKAFEMKPLLGFAATRHHSSDNDLQEVNRMPAPHS